MLQEILHVTRQRVQQQRYFQVLFLSKGQKLCDQLRPRWAALIELSASRTVLGSSIRRRVAY